MTLKERFEQKGKLLEQLKEAVNAKDFDQEKVDTINDDITKAEKEIRSIEKANEFLSKKTEINGEMKQEAPDFWNTLDTFFRTGENGTAENRKGTKKSIEIRADQLGRVTANKGGVLVPALLGDYIDAARAFIGGMVTPGLTDWQRVGTGNTITYATLDDTATKAAIVAEAGSLATGTDFTYGTAVLTFYKWATSFLAVSNELLQDSIYDVAGHVIGLLMERMYRGLNYHFTLGSGTAMPYGINATATKGEDCLARSVTRADLVNTIYSINRAYRSNGTWMMNDAIVKAIRALDVGSADSRPVWSMSMQAGEPDRLEGHPLVVNNEMEDFQPFANIAFFGDFKNYKVREVANGMKITRVDELYAETDEVGFNIMGRWAGNLVSGGAPIKSLRCAST
jgi:HK97 family phage major capsid protein